MHISGDPEMSVVVIIQGLEIEAEWVQVNFAQLFLCRSWSVYLGGFVLCIGVMTGSIDVARVRANVTNYLHL